MKRHGRTGVESAVACSAAGAHPWFGLRDAPVSQIQNRIVAAGYPGIAAGAEKVRQFTPCIAARLALLSHGVELPDLLTRLGVVGADKALFFPVKDASGEPLDHFALDND